MKDAKDTSTTGTKVATDTAPDDAKATLEQAVSSLGQAARAALGRMIAARTGEAATEAGHAVGLGAGIAVTEALRLAPGWNAPVLGADGKPVASVPGARRVGDHDIVKRDEEVVGPQITALVDKIPPGELRDFVAGLGQGATEAPGATYRLDAALDDAVDGKKPQ